MEMSAERLLERVAEGQVAGGASDGGGEGAGRSKQWYVVQAYSGYEKKVMYALKERIGLKGMGDYFGEVVVPTEEVLEMRAGQKRKSERMFFPGYVLVHMDMNEDTWQLVKNVPRVLGFIGGLPDKPAPITDSEASKILRRMEASEETPAHKTLYEVGEIVRVTDGPFNDFSGTVEKVNYDKSRLTVSLLIFDRATPVELEFTQVAKS